MGHSNFKIPRNMKYVVHNFTFYLFYESCSTSYYKYISRLNGNRCGITFTYEKVTVGILRNNYSEISIVVFQAVERDFNINSSDAHNLEMFWSVNGI